MSSATASSQLFDEWLCLRINLGLGFHSTSMYYYVQYLAAHVDFLGGPEKLEEKLSFPFEADTKSFVGEVLQMKSEPSTIHQRIADLKTQVGRRPPPEIRYQELIKRYGVLHCAPSNNYGNSREGYAPRHERGEGSGGRRVGNPLPPNFGGSENNNSSSNYKRGAESQSGREFGCKLPRQY